MASEGPTRTVLMVHDYPPVTGGGLALAVLELAGLLRGDDHVVVLSSRWRDHFADDRTRRGPCSTSNADVEVSRVSVWHAVRRFADADLVFTHWTFSVRRLATAALLLGPLLGKPTVCVVHTAPAHCRYNRMRRVPSRVRRTLLNVIARAMRRCRAVVALSEGHAAALRGIGFPVTHVIPLMVTLPPLAERHRAQPRERARIVGVAGELSVLKGADRLPAIVAGLAPDFAFRIAGTGPLEDRLRVELSALPADVAMCGWVPPESMPDFYRRIDFLLVASRTEAQSRVALEAMLAGVIVVAADDCGLASLVDDGVTGVLVDVDDVGAIRERLTELAGHPATMAAITRRACASAVGRLDDCRQRWQRLSV
jgi:glycosyltransferase involved in cell wall biosynthesis